MSIYMKQILLDQTAGCNLISNDYSCANASNNNSWDLILQVLH